MIFIIIIINNDNNNDKGAKISLTITKFVKTIHKGTISRRITLFSYLRWKMSEEKI